MATTAVAASLNTLGFRLAHRLPSGFCPRSRLPRPLHHAPGRRAVIVEAGDKHRWTELNDGFVLFTFSEDSDSERENDTPQVAGQSAIDTVVASSIGEGSEPAAHNVWGILAQVSLPPRHPSLFHKTSPVPAAKARAQASRARAAITRDFLTVSLSPVNKQSKTQVEVPRPPSAFSKRSPVQASIKKEDTQKVILRQKSRVQKGVRSSSRFSKRSALVDFKLRQLRKADETEATTPETRSTPVRAAALPARPPSRFVKRSPVEDFRRRNLRETQKVLLYRPPSGFRKHSPVLAWRQRDSHRVTITLRRSSSGSSERANMEAQTRPHSSFKKQSPVHAGNSRGARRRHLIQDDQNAGPGALVERVSDSMATQTEGEWVEQRVGVSAEGATPKRHPSQFKKKRRPLPAAKDMQSPKHGDAPNGVYIHNRIPIALPLGATSPALMEGWAPADSAADGLLVGSHPDYTHAGEGSDVEIEEEVVEEELSLLEEGSETESEEEGFVLWKRTTTRKQPSMVSLEDNVTAGHGQDEEWSASSLGGLKVTELRNMAKASGLKGYSKLKKAELVHLLIESQH